MFMSLALRSGAAGSALAAVLGLIDLSRRYSLAEQTARPPICPVEHVAPVCECLCGSADVAEVCVRLPKEWSGFWQCISALGAVCGAFGCGLTVERRRGRARHRDVVSVQAHRQSDLAGGGGAALEVVPGVAVRRARR